MLFFSQLFIWKGCIHELQCGNTSCVSRETEDTIKNPHYFCCCSGRNCNRDFTVRVHHTPSQPKSEHWATIFFCLENFFSFSVRRHQTPSQPKSEHQTPSQPKSEHYYWTATATSRSAYTTFLPSQRVSIVFFRNFYDAEKCLVSKLFLLWVGCGVCPPFPCVSYEATKRVSSRKYHFTVHVHQTPSQPKSEHCLTSFITKFLPSQKKKLRALSQLRICRHPLPLSFDPIFMKVAQRAESNVKSIWAIKSEHCLTSFIRSNSGRSISSRMP